MPGESTFSLGFVEFVLACFRGRGWLGIIGVFPRWADAAPLFFLYDRRNLRHFEETK